MGAAVVGRLPQGKRQGRSQTPIGGPGFGCRTNPAPSQEARRGPFGPDQPGEVATAIRAQFRGLCGTLLHAPVLSYPQTFHAESLPSNFNPSPLARSGRVPPARYRNSRPATVCIAKDAKRFELGIRQPSPQSHLTGLRDGQEMELPPRGESRERYIAARENFGSRKARTDSKPDPWSARIAQRTGSHHGSAGHTDGDAGGRDPRSAAEGRRFSFRADPNRTGELSRYLRNTEDERQQTLTAHSQKTRLAAHARLWTPRADRRRALSISNLPRQAAQRFESPAPAFETRGTEDRCTVAQLAYTQANPRYFVADRRSFPERCASTTRSQQDVHDARALHGADSRALAGSSRKPFAIGDEWGRVWPNCGGSSYHCP